MSQIPSATSFVSSQSEPTDAYSKLTSGDFVKIILSELSRQDPLKPNDSSQLVQDMSNLRSIQASVDLTDKIGGLIGDNQATNASGLIGKAISGLDEDFNRVSGIVSSVSKTKDGPVLNLVGGARVAYDNVDELVDRDTAQNQLVYASGLIGKRVSGIDIDGNEFVGTVESVTQSALGPVLNFPQSSPNLPRPRMSLFDVREIDQPAPTTP
jgi:flagellar basal-body rod modification protein FlgD